jgi:hypothetical protein
MNQLRRVKILDRSGLFSPENNPDVIIEIKIPTIKARLRLKGVKSQLNNNQVIKDVINNIIFIFTDLKLP